MRVPAASLRARQAGSDEPELEDPGVPGPTAGAVPPPACPAWFELVVLVAAAAVLSFGGVGLFLADLGHYSAPLALPLGLAGTTVLAALAWPRTRERERGDTSRGAQTAALGAIAVAVAQLAWNGVDASRHVAADRDPGVYVLVGKWLAQHGSLVVPATKLWPIPGPLFSLSSGGVYQMPNGTVQFQFAHLLSVLLAEADNLGGDRLMFRVPAVLGALGLCAVYAVGCRLVRRPWLVLAALTALAVCLPELNVTRDAFSEPATQVLLWGGILLVLRAYETGRGSVAFVAGLFLGGTVMTHIDAIIYLAPLPILCAIGWLISRRWSHRRPLAGPIGWGLLGVVPPAVLATFDVQRRAGLYYDDLSSQMHALYLLLAVTITLAVVFVGLWSARPELAHRASVYAAEHRGAWAVALGWAAGVALLIGWALRPAKAVFGPSGPAATVVGQIQTGLGLPLQPDRTYAEQTLRWFEWYIGPVALALGIIGLGILVTWAVKYGRVTAVVLLVVLGGVVALYLWQPSITPDQIFVTRRYVTSALPLFLLAAAFALDVGADAVLRHAQTWTWARPMAAVGAASLIVFPLGTTSPVRNFHSQASWLPMIEHVCSVLGPQAAIVFPAGDYDGATLPLTLADWCQLPSATLLGPEPSQALVPTAQDLQRSGRVLWVLAWSKAEVSRVLPGLSPTLLGTAVSTEELERTLESPPENYATVVLNIYGARVT